MLFYCTGPSQVTKLKRRLEQKLPHQLHFVGLGYRTSEEPATMLQALHGSGVTTLNLSANGLDLKTGEELATMLQALHGSGVTTLDLSWNRLNTRTGEELATMLQALYGSGVTTLNLQHNTFSSETVKVLVQIVLTNPSHFSATTILLDTDLHPFVTDALVDEYETLIQTGSEQKSDGEIILDVEIALTSIERAVTLTRCFGVTAPETIAPETIMSGMQAILLQLLPLERLAPICKEEEAGEKPESIQAMQARLLRLTRACLQSLKLTPPEIVINIIEQVSEAFASPLFTGEVAQKLGINGYACRVAIFDEFQRVTGQSLYLAGHEETLQRHHTAMIWYAEKHQQEAMDDDKEKIAGQAAKDGACRAALYRAYETLYDQQTPGEALQASRFSLQKVDQTYSSTPLVAQARAVEISHDTKLTLSVTQGALFNNPDRQRQGGASQQGSVENFRHVI